MNFRLYLDNVNIANGISILSSKIIENYWNGSVTLRILNGNKRHNSTSNKTVVTMMSVVSVGTEHVKD